MKTVEKNGVRIIFGDDDVRIHATKTSTTMDWRAEIVIKREDFESLIAEGLVRPALTSRIASLSPEEILYGCV